MMINMHIKYENPFVAFSPVIKKSKTNGKSVGIVGVVVAMDIQYIWHLLYVCHLSIAIHNVGFSHTCDDEKLMHTRYIYINCWLKRFI